MSLDAIDPKSPDDYAQLDEPDWDFYELGVWRQPEGFYMSTDSGCSCPTPFENHSTSNPEDFTGPLTLDQVAEEARSLAKDDYGRQSVEALIERLGSEATV
jgi:hypothetical protein